MRLSTGTETALVVLFILIVFPIFFTALWVGITLLMSFIGGWGKVGGLGHLLSPARTIAGLSRFSKNIPLYLLVRWCAKLPRTAQRSKAVCCFAWETR